MDVKNEVTKVLMTVQIQSPDALEAVAGDMEQRAENIANVSYSAPNESGEAEITLDERTLRVQEKVAAGGRVGRNDPCPCGSGKKYKQCHGKLA